MSNIERHNEPDNLEVFFAKHLRESSMTPAASTWENIEKVLDQDKKRSKRRFFWFFLIGIGLLGGVSTLCLFMFGDQINDFISAKNKSLADSSLNTSVQLNKKTSDPVTETYDKEIPNDQNLAPASNSSPVKIQIGAFRKNKDQSYFQNISLP